MRHEKKSFDDELKFDFFLGKMLYWSTYDYFKLMNSSFHMFYFPLQDLTRMVLMTNRTYQVLAYMLFCTYLERDDFTM